jgi:L-amino acid N-acyltransferase YncA
MLPVLKSQGYITLIAGITTPNPASERLHQAFGFRHIGTFARVGWKFGRWHDVGYWQAMLSEANVAPASIRSVNEVMRVESPAHPA